MVKIAHRGNYQGKNPERENTVAYIKEALDAGYWVEVDVQCSGGHMFFGHDGRQEIIDYGIIKHPNVICHAKDLESLSHLLLFDTHCFWHEEDNVTLTSQKLIWCYPNVHLVDENAIWLDFTGAPFPSGVENIFGICTDDFTNYKY